MGGEGRGVVGGGAWEEVVVEEVGDGGLATHGGRRLRSGREKIEGVGPQPETVDSGRPGRVASGWRMVGGE